MANKRRLVALLPVSLALAGCPGDDDGHSGSNVCDGSSVAYDSYSAGLEKAGETAKIRLLDAQPAPPARGNNEWQVQVLDSGDAPIGDAVITRVKPFMPDHGHGPSTEPDIGEVADDGTAAIRAIDFMMPGVWTITFSVDSASGPDAAVFAFCIDG